MARLILENGLTFEGISFGANIPTSGEVVFNTGMVGYPESLSDPSYKGQIIVTTYPMIGNYGVPGKKMQDSIALNFESEKIQCSGLIVTDYSEKYSHWDGKKTLAEWLQQYNVPALTGIDTRKLTKILREKGTMLGKIIFDKDIPIEDPNAQDIVQQVSVKQPMIYKGKNAKRVVVIDCGIKHNILRNLMKREVTIIQVPYDYDFSHEQYDAILISNGPGDPKMCTKTIEHVRKAMEKNVPIFGICLGNQILALAAGGNTYKLKYGHRSQNQPCVMKGTKRCFITSQNHGFAVDIKSLSEEWEEWFVNANDGTNEGIRHKKKPFMSVQYHPESNPGPNDTEFLFDEFLRMI